MSLLQHPIRALEQIEWYLDNERFESFPGAFFLAAGNLARQVLEQIIYIIAFYSRMPRNKYLKTSNKLHVLGRILRALQETDPQSGRRYIEQARRRGSRIRKFARYPISLDRWRKLLNEPSHFANPAARRTTNKEHIRNFVNRFKSIFEEVDGYLITAAVNEIRSNGTVRATLSNDQRNIPGVQCDVIVTPKNIVLSNGKLVLRTPQVPVQIVPATEEVPYRWTMRVVLVQHSHGMNIGFRLITESGIPLDLTDMNTIINTFVSDQRTRHRLVHRLKQLGLSFRYGNK